jgi:hypothetical protein
MRIPSGDLAPARKHRRRYGRRRSYAPLLVALVLVVAIGGGSFLLRREDNKAGAATTPHPCRTTVSASAAPIAAPPAAVRLPPPSQVALRLLNGTGRNRLAQLVGNELARRGFRVSGMGNAPSALQGASRVTYGAGARPAALLVSAHVLGAVVVPLPSLPPGTVDVVLGSGFVRLRTPAEVAGYVRALPSGPGAAPAPSPRPAVTAGCR